MEKSEKIVLVGNTLLMTGVAVGLRDQNRFEVIQTDPDELTSGRCLESLSPDLIVFELDTPHESLIFCQLKERTNIILIGLDLVCNRAVVINTHTHLTHTMEAFSQLVQIELNHQTAHAFDELTE